MNDEAPSKARPAALVFIFITLVLDMLALGMIVPVLPKLVEDFVHGDTARAAYIVGVFGAVWALMHTGVDLAAKRHHVELVEHGPVETLEDAIGLRALTLVRM